MRSPREVAREVLETEAAAVRGLVAQLDERFDRAVELLRACSGRVVCTGMGKSGIVMKKIAATLSSTGTPALFLHPAEAVHGDLGMIVPGDVVLAASYSGTTEELLRLVETLKRLGVPLVAMTGNAGSPARPPRRPPPAGGDRPRGLSARTSRPRPRPPPRWPWATPWPWRCSRRAASPARTSPSSIPPASSASACSRSSSSCTRATPCPRCTLDTPMRDAIYEMSKKGLGITAVSTTEASSLGCISDGDLRRLLRARTTAAPAATPPASA